MAELNRWGRGMFPLPLLPFPEPGQRCPNPAPVCATTWCTGLAFGTRGCAEQGCHSCLRSSGCHPRAVPSPYCQPSGTQGRAVPSRVPAPLGTHQGKGGDEVSAAAGKQQGMMPGQGPGCWGRSSCAEGGEEQLLQKVMRAGKRGSLGQVWKEKCTQTGNEGKNPNHLTPRVPWLHHTAALVSTAFINTSLQQGGWF